MTKAIDALFENSSAATLTETEQAFKAGFIAMAGNLALLLNGIGLAVAFTILLVTANTMSMAVRERRTEIGVLKTLGFSSAHVMGFVVGEALVLGVLGGALGVFGSQVLLYGVSHSPGVSDILAGIGKTKRRDQVLVGFAAETNDVVAYGQEKLKRKNADLFVANDVSRSDIGFSADENEVHLLFADGRVEKVEKAAKKKIANAILDAAKADHAAKL